MTPLRTFYILVVTQALSLIGSRMTSIAVGIRVFADTGDTTPLLLAAFFNELPGLVGNSLAGVLVDRWDRRRVLMLADAGQAAGTFLLMISFLSGAFQVWHLYAVALLQGTFAIFQAPAKDAATTLLVPDEGRDRANAVQAMIFPFAGIVAPALAGLLHTLVGAAGVMLIDLLSFGVAVVTVYWLRIPKAAQSDEGRAAAGNFWRELRGGFVYLASRRALLALVLYFTLLNFLLNGPLELSVPYVITITGSEATAGLVLAINSLGGVIGAGLLAARGKMRSRIHVTLPAMFLVGLMFLFYGTARYPIWLAVSIFLLMLPLQTWALFTSLVQAKTPPDMQGRVFAIIGQLGFLGATASFVLTGPLVDQVLEPAAQTPGWQSVAWLVGNQPGAGMGLVLVVTGALIMAATVLVYALPAVRRIEVTLPNYEPTASENLRC